MEIQKSEGDNNSSIILPFREQNTHYYALFFSAAENTSAFNEVEENTTFYYSNFKLFNEQSELMFTKYLLFKSNLKKFLGNGRQMIFD